ncbi:MAG: hypothetical protein R6V59_08165 [Dehalococcoidia bacterium]
MPDVMSNKMYSTLSSRTMVLHKVRKHYHHGSGPLFSYSLYLKKPLLPAVFGEYSFQFMNELHAAGGMLHVSHSGRQYSTPLHNVELYSQGAQTGIIVVDDVILLDMSRGSLSINFRVKDAATSSLLAEMVEFFGY